MLMSGVNVISILEGRKNQTRRIVKFPKNDALIYRPWQSRVAGPGLFKTKYLHVPFRHRDEPDDGCSERLFPPLEPGDRLWVKETFAEHPEFPGTYLYRADRGGDYQGAAQGAFKWKSGRFMPRRASRITLEILSVRVERLQEISEEDAKAEGFPLGVEESICASVLGRNDPARIGFGETWDRINGKGAWAKNPFVWCISFKRV